MRRSPEFVSTRSEYQERSTTYVLDKIQEDNPFESNQFGERFAVIDPWLESFVELENGHDCDNGADKSYDSDLSKISNGSGWVSWHS